MLPASHVDPVLSSGSGISDLFNGLALPFRAFKLVLTTPRLLLLSMFCALVTGVTLICLFIFLWEPATWLAARWVGTGGWHDAAGKGVAVVLYLAMLGVGLLTVPNLLLAPLQDPLSEATEAKLGNFSAPAFSFARLVKGTTTTLFHTLWRLGLMLIGFAIRAPIDWRCR